MARTTQMLAVLLWVAASAPAAAQTAQPKSAPASAGQPDSDLSRSARIEARVAANLEKQRAALTEALREVEREQAASASVLPWLATGLGVALAAIGIGVGAGKALSCDDASCPAPFWTSWATMGGATVTAAGGVWIALHEREMAELRSRRYHIEREIQYMEWEAAPIAGSRPPTVLAWRGHFD